MKWRKARKKPVVIEFREVEPNCTTEIKGVWVEAERITTREGQLYGYPTKDYVIRGVKGEIYSIGKAIFKETYEIIDEAGV